MTLSLSKRIDLAEQASADLAFARIAEYDKRFRGAIHFGVCPCEACKANPSGARLLKAKPVTNRKVLGRVGILLIAASALGLFLILKGLPILRALNY